MIAIFRSIKKNKFFFLPFLVFAFTCFATTSFGQGAVVSGRVTSSTGDPLPGVSVVVKGSKKGTSTDNSGNFSLSGVSPNATLVISSSGYDRQEIAVNGRSNIDVSMVTSTTALEQVVVIGYGTANKRDLTGSIVKVSGKEVADKPNSNRLHHYREKWRAYRL